MSDKNTSDLLRRLNTPPPKKNNNTRNALILLGGVAVLILLALIFVGQKEIHFDPVKNTTSTGNTQQVIFTGELKMRDLGLTDADQKKLDRLLAETTARFKQVQIWVERDNKYDTVGPGTELRYQVFLLTHDGATIRSVVHRSKQGNLVNALKARIDKDTADYLRTNPGKNPPGSFTNTN